MSAPGKVVLYVIDALKPVSVGLIIAALTSNLVQFLLRGGQGKGRAKLKNHIVICGWSSKGAEIIDQLRRRGDDAGRSPVVILAKLNANPSRDDLTTFISGDPTNPDDLVRAGITQAKTAIILADNSIQGQDVEDSDSRSLLTVLAVESLAPQVYTCVEVVRNENQGHFRRTKADEVVVSARMTGSLLAHSAATHGLSKVVGELLAFPEGNEFYWLPVPAWLVGKTFGDALVELKRRADCLPIAVATGDQAYQTNPPMDHPDGRAGPPAGHRQDVPRTSKPARVGPGRMRRVVVEQRRRVLVGRAGRAYRGAGRPPSTGSACRGCPSAPGRSSRSPRRTAGRGSSSIRSNVSLQTALAVLDHERDVVGAHLERGARPEHRAAGVEAEAGIEEPGVVRAQLAARRVVGGHLRRQARRDAHRLVGQQQVEAPPGASTTRSPSSLGTAVPEVLAIVPADLVELERPARSRAPGSRPVRRRRRGGRG